MISLGWFKPAEIFNKRYEYRKLMDEDVGRSDREPENLDGKPEERGYLETLQASLDFREEKLRKRREEAKQELKDIAFYTILISIVRNPKRIVVIVNFLCEITYGIFFAASA